MREIITKFLLVRKMGFLMAAGAGATTVGWPTNKLAKRFKV